MTNLVEVAQWEPEIYQLETSDPVMGGPDGIDNRQAKQLANRTFWMKRWQEGHEYGQNPHPQYATTAALKASLDALVGAAPGALDTLKELGNALGDDPNFATTMTRALALKAPLASPAFSGMPTAPTPAQFDNSTKLATTAAMVRHGLQASGMTGTYASGTLSASVIGGTVIADRVTQTQTLMSAASVPAGARIEFFSAVKLTITAAAGDQINLNGSSVSAMTLDGGDTLTLESGGSLKQWFAVGGSAQLGASAQLRASLTYNGYQKLPSGLIFQWVGGASGENGVMALTLPIAFKSAIFGGIANESSPSGWGPANTTVWAFDWGSSSLTSAVARVRGVNGSIVGGYPGIGGRILVWGV
jgi:hypothetical protein